MIGPTVLQHKNVAPFDEAFFQCLCPSCALPIVWEGLNRQIDNISEHHPEELPPYVRHWSGAHCGVVYRLEWVLQRPSDHSTPYGYVWRVEEAQ
jgi:hypothetical protein